MTIAPPPSPAGDFVLTLDCPDRPGIVHAVASFLMRHGGNIMESQQFGDQRNWAGSTCASTSPWPTATPRLHHAHHFGALLVDRRGVEVVDLHVRVRAYRMGGGACVLGELHGEEPLHVLNALERREPTSLENSWSRKTVKPSLRLS